MLEDKISIKDLYLKLKNNYSNLVGKVDAINSKLLKTNFSFKNLLKKYITLKRRYIILYSNSSQDVKNQIEKVSSRKYELVFDDKRNLLKVPDEFLENIEMTHEEFIKSIYIDSLFDKYFPAPDLNSAEKRIEPFTLPVMIKNFNVSINKNIHPFVYYKVSGRMIKDKNSAKFFYQLIFKDITPEVELNYIQNADNLLTSLSLSNFNLKEAMKTIEMHKIMMIFMTGSLIEEYHAGSIGQLHRIEEITSCLTGECARMGKLKPDYCSLEQYVKDINFSSVFFDIGMMGIPKGILEKGDALSDDEKKIMMNHPSIGASYIKRMMEFLKLKPGFLSYLKFLQTPYDICLYHHERWDGNGYPEKLNGDRIPITARIVAVAYEYDTLRNKRGNLDPKAHEDIAKIIINQAGAAFDPVIVEAFLRVSPLLEKINYHQKF